MEGIFSSRYYRIDVSNYNLKYVKYSTIARIFKEIIDITTQYITYIGSM